MIQEGFNEEEQEEGEIKMKPSVEKTSGQCMHDTDI